MNQVREKLFSCLESLKKKTDFKPEVALVLGSGLGDYAEHIEVKETVDYKDLEGFPVSTVAGHKGRFVFEAFRLSSCREECITMKDIR